MKVSYGPPGHHGVTHLMAVGADDHELGEADQAIHRGIVGAVITVAAGYVLDMPRARTAGIGALIALFLVHRAARKPQLVAVAK